MRGRRLREALLAVAAAGAVPGCAGCGPDRVFTAELRPTLEDKLEGGALYNPSTQSFLRTKHWLETAQKIQLTVHGGHRGELEFQSPDTKGRLKVVDIP